MFEKYPLIVSRYEELSEAIVQPDIIADTARYQAYLKERAALEEQVTAWQSYQSLLRHREQAQEMLSDPDLHEMAAEELQSLAAQIADAEQQLRILLLPRDPDDDHAVIMEIRGGAGGEESCGITSASSRFRRRRRSWAASRKQYSASRAAAFSRA